MALGLMAVFAGCESKVEGEVNATEANSTVEANVSAEANSTVEVNETNETNETK